MHIHDATIYRSRDNHGRNNHKFTRPQLERMLREAPKPIPILDSHNYHIPIIGGVKRCWFGADGWLHFSAQLGDKKQLGAFRHANLKERFQKGQLNCTSISVAMKYLDAKKTMFDPSSARIVEFSLCKKGEHKNTTIQVLEASDTNQVKRHIESGAIEQLQIPWEKMSTAALVQANPGPAAGLSMNDILEECTAAGIQLSEKEMEELTQMPLQTVAAVIMRRMADSKRTADIQMTENEKELARLRELEKTVKDDYMKQREPEVKSALEFYDEKLTSQGVPPEKREAIKLLVAKLGTDKETAPLFDLLSIGNKTAATLQKEKEEKQKEVDTLTSQVRAFERKARITDNASAKPREAEKKATPAPAEREESAAKRQRVPAPIDTKNVPENLGQKLASKYSNGEVPIESSAGLGDLPWIDTLFPSALQGSFARSVEARSMTMLHEIMSETDFKERALHTVIPEIGKQGFAQQARPFAWGK
jgi:hypothetical protein